MVPCGPLGNRFVCYSCCGFEVFRFGALGWFWCWLIVEEGSTPVLFANRSPALRGLTMKVNSEECETLLSSGVHHLSPPSLLRSKSGLDDMAGDSLYSPTRKSSKSESMSRVHCIPLLMVFVFFVLWAASSGTSTLFLRLHCSDEF